ncbi:MAG: hypothetical protein AAF211_01395 [Myxococcota bacterium]
MMLGMLGLAVGAHARDLIREPPAARVPEAFYVVEGEVPCRVRVAMDAAGRVTKAKAVGCPSVTHAALESAARRARFAAADGPGAEEIAVTLKPPEFTPRSARGECLVAVLVDGSDARLLADPPRRCTVVPGPVDPPTVASTRRTRWCVVDFRVEGGERIDVTTPHCPEAARAVGREVVQRWDLAVDKDQRWRLLVGFPSRRRER